MRRPILSAWLAICTALGLSLAVSRVASAAEAAAAAPTAAPSAKSLDAAKSVDAAKSLDDQLLQNLDNNLDGKLLGDSATKTSPSAPPTDTKTPDPKSAAPRPETAKPSAPQPPAKKPSPLVDPLDDELSNSLSAGEDIGSPGEDAKNPLARIVVQMRQVQQRLADSKSDRLTQQEQQRISDELKSLVEQMTKQCQGGQCQNPGAPSNSQQASRSTPKPGNPGSGNSGSGKTAAGEPNKNPARNSTPKLRASHTDRPDPTVQRDVVAKELDRLHLPEKDRDAMLEAPPDEFLPGHESSIEEYFKRLVEQEDAK